MPVIAATAYIWYPEGENVGHASMHLGHHKEYNDTDWYVSWWPQNSAGPFDKFAADPKTLNNDIGQGRSRSCSL